MQMKVSNLPIKPTILIKKLKLSTATSFLILGSYNSERWEVYLGGVEKKKDDDYSVSGRKNYF